MFKTDKELISLEEHCPKQLSVIMEIFSAWSNIVAIGYIHVTIDHLKCRCDQVTEF